MNCPRCGSTNIQAVSQQVVTGKVVDTRKTKGFGWCKACIGTLLTGGIGFFCGLCGMGKTKGKFEDTREYKNEITYCCLDCGHQFK